MCMLSLLLLSRLLLSLLPLSLNRLGLERLILLDVPLNPKDNFVARGFVGHKRGHKVEEPRRCGENENGQSTKTTSRQKKNKKAGDPTLNEPRARAHPHTRALIMPRRTGGPKPITPGLAKDELIRRLKALSSHLEEIDNGQSTDAAREHAEALRPLLSNRTVNVRVLVACCLADIFRILVPDLPYDDAGVKAVLVLFASLLPGIADINGASFERHFHLLETFAETQTFLLAARLEQHGIVQDVFSGVLESARTEHNSKVLQCMQDILASTIEEDYQLRADTLDVLFRAILPANKVSHSAAYTVAAEFINKCAKKLSLNVTAYFNGLLGIDEEVESEHAENAIELIEALAAINIDVLMRVVPQCETLLRSEDVPRRLSATVLLARLFSQAPTEMASLHRAQWHHLLQRLQDREPSIRAELTSHLGQLINIMPTEFRSDLLDRLKTALMDMDETVRFMAVETAATVLQDHLPSCPMEFIDTFTDRRLDKKLNVRKLAIDRLPKLYQHVQSQIEETGSADAETETKAAKLAVATIASFNTRDTEIRLHTENGLQKHILPDTLDPSLKAQRLLHICRHGNDRFWSAVRGMLKIKAGVARLFRSYLERRRGTDNLRETPFFNTLKMQLVSQKAHASMDLLDEEASEQLLDALQSFVSEDSRHALVLVEAKKQLTKLTPKNCAKAVTELVVKLHPFPFDCDAVDALLLSLHSASEAGEDELCAAGAKFLAAYSEEGQGVFSSPGVFKSLTRLAASDSPQLCSSCLAKPGRTALRILAASGENLASIEPGLHKMLRKKLVELATTGDVAEAELAVDALAAICGDKAESSHESIVKKCLEHLDQADERLSASLAALAGVAWHAPDVFRKHDPDIVSRFIVDDLLMNARSAIPEEDTSTDEWVDQPDLDIVAKEQAVRLLVNRLRGRTRSEHDEDRLTKLGAPTFRLFQQCLDCYGDFERVLYRNVEKSRMRLAVACGMLELAATEIRQVIPIQLWHLVAMTMQDSCVEVRSKFNDRLYQLLSKNKLPVGYMSFFVYSAIDPDPKCRRLSAERLRELVTRKRNLARTAGPSTTESGREHLLPEYSLPFLLHLLAHHSDFTYTSEALLSFVPYLEFFFEAVCHRGEESFTFLKSMVDAMKRMEDAAGEDSTHLWAVCDLTAVLIVDLASRPGWKLKSFPGHIALPKALFRRPTRPVDSSRSYLPENFQLRRSTTAKTPTRNSVPATASHRPDLSESEDEGSLPSAKKKKSTPRSTGKRKTSRTPTAAATPPPQRRSARAAKRINDSLADLDDDELDAQALRDNIVAETPQSAPNSHDSTKTRGRRIGRPPAPALSDEEDEDKNDAATSPGKAVPASPEPEAEPDSPQPGARQTRRSGRTAGKTQAAASDAAPAPKLPAHLLYNGLVAWALLQRRGEDNQSAAPYILLCLKKNTSESELAEKLEDLIEGPARPLVAELFAVLRSNSYTTATSASSSTHAASSKTSQSAPSKSRLPAPPSPPAQDQSAAPAPSTTTSSDANDHGDKPTHTVEAQAPTSEGRDRDLDDHPRRRRSLEDDDDREYRRRGDSPESERPQAASRLDRAVREKSDDNNGYRSNNSNQYNSHQQDRWRMPPRRDMRGGRGGSNMPRRGPMPHNAPPFGMGFGRPDNMPIMMGMANMQELQNMQHLQDMQGMPNMPMNMQNLQNMQNMQGMPNMPNMPNMQGPMFMGPSDMGPPNMGPSNMGPPDMGPPDMGSQDMNMPSMGPPNMESMMRGGAPPPMGGPMAFHGGEGPGSGYGNNYPPRGHRNRRDAHAPRRTGGPNHHGGGAGGPSPMQSALMALAPRADDPRPAPTMPTQQPRHRPAPPATTLEVTGVPSSLMDEDKIREYFAGFGDLELVVMNKDQNGNPASDTVLVQFCDLDHAKQAFTSEKAVLDNRFIKLNFSRRPAQSLAKSASDTGLDSAPEQTEAEPELKPSQKIVPKWQAQELAAKTQRKRAVDMERKRQDLIKMTMKSQQDLLKELETTTLSDAERKKKMKDLQQSIKLLNQLKAKKPSIPIPEPARRPSTDSTDSGAPAAKRVAAGSEETAPAAGDVSTTRGRGLYRGRGYTRGRSWGRGRGRGRGRGHATTTVLDVTGYRPDHFDLLTPYFACFGNFVSVVQSGDQGRALVTFKDRRSAETAKERARNFNGRALEIEWFDPFAETPATEDSVSEQAKGQEALPTTSENKDAEDGAAATASTTAPDEGAETQAEGTDQVAASE
ncbi:uncharacterized protein MONBRDRAFT_32239 [Monosiga brevicollis MX1]|uniref:RRM domain-containing protein n=1 Tax=Monosiga brevicollis TaxID=81824 RepID=A9UXM9_MONBE|nr:uncharacterized protein MONBRDRAFT_32239 [Monosiga brevicollis MX1]EDQ90038.1 predicted protein [Monosiga brevicollis MX1]|eukprot:XP_001745460.1 hypothetical protein [Monosiga brevicollis MX1]